jgi:hypothetical protein
MTGYKRNIDTYKDSESYMSCVTNSIPAHAYSSRHTKEDRVNENSYFETYPEIYGWTIIRSLPKEISDLEQQFNKLAADWKKQTAIYSNTLHIIRNDNYLDIIGMGKDALPLILRDLEKAPEHWFVALKAIAKENPVPKEAYGNIDQMRFYWLQWGKNNNII